MHPKSVEIFEEIIKLPYELEIEDKLNIVSEKFEIHKLPSDEYKKLIAKEVQQLYIAYYKGVVDGIKQMKPKDI